MMDQIFLVMESVKGTVLLVITEDEWNKFRLAQEEILNYLRTTKSNIPSGITIKYITAKEFMAAVRIGRTKFDQLTQSNKIRVLKKRRKLYVPLSEVERYFNDPAIQ
jgi:hypothetical protein